MGFFKAAGPRLRVRSHCFFSGVVVTLFLFSCSQNPVSVYEPVSKKDACATQSSTQSAIHQIVPPPSTWNGDLVVYAHGFVSPTAPIAIPSEASQFAAITMSAGYAFATTSYPANGMAIPEALTDLVRLVNEFKTAYPSTKRVLIIGVSMGGLVAVQAAENYPKIFNGVLAISGVYGDYVLSVSHVANFRAVFDYFFPGIIPGDACSVPTQTLTDWQTVYLPQVVAALSTPQNADKVKQLLTVTKLPVDTADPKAIIKSMATVLSLHVWGSEDIVARLGGNPFDNRLIRYCGSTDDKALNAGVKRFKADPVAIKKAIAKYNSTGRLLIPAVTMHSTGDHIAPISQQVLYGAKVLLARRGSLYTSITINGFGHVSFNQQQIQTAFQTLVAKVAAVSSKPDPRGSRLNVN